MTIFAPQELSGRRPDQLPPALYFDRFNVAVDAGSPFIQKVGRRLQPGGLVRLTAVLIPSADLAPVTLSLGFGTSVGILAVDEAGLWTVASDDADPIPVAGDRPLLGGVSHAVSICVDVVEGLHHDVIVEGLRVKPQVTDEVQGETPDPIELVVDILSDGTTVPLPDWARAQIANYDANALLAIARKTGGRIVLEHQPPAPVELVARPAPLLTLDGDHPPVFTFSLSAGAPVTVERIFAVQASS